MSDNRKLHVFFSYSSKDRPEVMSLYKRLTQITWIDAWVDVEKLLPGHKWDMEIANAVADADIIIVCCSKESVIKDGYLQRELRYVLDEALEKPEGSIFIIPLRLNDCELPRILKDLEYADYFPPDQRDTEYNRLMLSLKSRAKHLGIDMRDTQALDPSTAPALRVASKPIYTRTQYNQRACFEDILSGKVIYLPEKQIFTIGRMVEGSDSIPDLDLGDWDDGGYISRKHAEMKFYMGRYFIMASLNAKNGTFVNGEKVSAEMVEVKDGDIVSFAKSHCRFRYKPHRFT